MEPEYQALAYVTAEIVWSLQLLCDLYVLLLSLWCDDIGATYLTVIRLHPRTKHIEIDFHFV